MDGKPDSAAAARQAPRRSARQDHVWRRPAIPAACALAAGIWIDSVMAWNWWGWVAVCMPLAVLAFSFNSNCSKWRENKRWAIASSMLTLLLLMGFGGARHHLAVSLRSPFDISTWGGSEPVTLRVTGVILSPIEIRDPPVGPQIPSWMEIDRSICQFRCEQLRSLDGVSVTSGNVQLEVTGHLVHAQLGDRVEVLGQFSVPQPPANPGGGDFAAALREQGLAGILRCEHPAAVSVLGRETGWLAGINRLRDRIRRHCQKLLAQELRPQQRALASSLLIGDRTGMTDDVRQQFSESGAMHLLAISGVHVSILYGIVWAGCRLLNLSFGRTVWVLLLCVGGYAFIADHRPPVMRAAVLASLALLGTARGRSVDGMQALALTALLLMVWHPSDLFDVGAQLSFLAVAAIVWIHQALTIRAEQDRLAPDLRPEVPPWREWLQKRGQGVAQAAAVTAYVWIVTLPLTISVFHLATPIGLLSNLFLIPYSTLVLGLGFAFLAIGFLLPSALWLISAPFAWSLDFFQTCVAWAGTVDAGHSYWPAAPGWWQFGFYLLLAMSWGWWAAGAWSRRGAQLWLVWLSLGLALPLWPVGENSLRCTFLSVGHGLAVIVELPRGPALGYDAGTLGDGRRAERAVENFLWNRGRVRLDGLLVSHADHDHFSGAFGLLDKLDVRQLCLAQTALSATDPGIGQLGEQAAARGIPIRLLQAGDELVPLHRKSGEVRMTLLHPSGNFRSRDDNANSLVLEINYAGRTILLTGDLERDGLDQLLQLAPRPVDVLLAPHHGGAAANVPQLYSWATPEIVIASAADAVDVGLRRVVGKAKLFSTATSGAVTVTISPDGKLRVEEFLKRTP